MSGKIKAKSNYKARGSSVDLYCSVHVHHAARSAHAAKDAEEGMDLNLNFVMAGMMLTLFVLFLAEGICASIRKER